MSDRQDGTKRSGMAKGPFLGAGNTDGVRGGSSGGALGLTRTALPELHS